MQGRLMVTAYPLPHPLKENPGMGEMPGFRDGGPRMGDHIRPP